MTCTPPRTAFPRPPKRLVALGAALVIALAAGAPAPSRAQEKGAEKKMTPEQEKLMAYSQPGEHHAALEPLVGMWKAAVRFWPAPDAEPIAMSGSLERRWILGDRFLVQWFESSPEASAFLGTGFIGYNNASNEYEGAWIDNEGTGMLITKGKMNGKTLRMDGVYVDPATGSTQPFAFVTHIVSPDENRFEILEPGPGGKEYRKLEIVYTK
jgi:hypothetical protein